MKEPKCSRSCPWSRENTVGRGREARIRCGKPGFSAWVSNTSTSRVGSSTWNCCAVSRACQRWSGVARESLLGFYFLVLIRREKEKKGRKRQNKPFGYPVSRRLSYVLLVSIVIQTSRWILRSSCVFFFFCSPPCM